MNITFTPYAFEQCNNWNKENRELFEKTKEVVRQIIRDPFKGAGKHQPLNGNYKGF